MKKKIKRSPWWFQATWEESKLPTWLIRVKAEVSYAVGLPCSDFSPDCPVCKAWSGYVILASFFDTTL